MIDDDDTVRLVDFEACRPVGSDPAQYPRTSGFAPEPGTAAWADDAAYVAYGVDAIEAATIMPRNALLAFRPEVFSRALAVTARQLDLPLNDLPERLGLPVASGEPDDLLADTLRGPAVRCDSGAAGPVVPRPPGAVPEQHTLPRVRRCRRTARVAPARRLGLG